MEWKARGVGKIALVEDNQEIEEWKALDEFQVGKFSGRFVAS